MNTRAHHYLLRIVAAIVCAMLVLITASPLLLAFVAPSPAKAATRSVPPQDPGLPQVPAQLHTVVTSGMPGWQIALIATGAAVLAAILAVAADRARAARQRQPAPTR